MFPRTASLVCYKYSLSFKTKTQVFTKFEIKQSEIKISFERSFSKFCKIIV